MLFYVAGGFAIFMVVFVVPSFDKMYAEFELRLPPMTGALMGLSRWMQKYWALTLGISVLLPLLLYGMGRFQGFAKFSKINFAGVLAGTRSSLLGMSRFSELLAVLIEMKAPLAEAIEIAGRGCDHPLYQSRSVLLAASIRMFPGKNIQSFEGLPPLVVRALNIGVGAPDVALLRALSANYRDGAGEESAQWHGYIEPIAILLVGLMIAYIVIALFFPMIGLITSLSG